MIKNIIKKNMIDFYGKWLLLVSAIFTLDLIPILRTSVYEHLTHWEFVLQAMTDHYYILFAMVIAYIYYVLKIMKNDEQEILIRSKKYINYSIAKIISIISVSGVLVAMHLIIAMIMGISLPIQNIFTGSSTNEVLSVYPLFFKNPLSALIDCLVFMISGLSFLGIVMMIFNHFLKPVTVVILTVLLYFMMILNLNIGNNSIVPYLFLDNYIILHHAIAVWGYRFYMVLIFELSIVITMLFLIKFWWHKRPQFPKIKLTKNGIGSLYRSMLFSKKNLFIIFISLCVISLSIIITYPKITFNDLLLLQFYGHGIGYFDMMAFLRMLLFNGIPIYLLCIFIAKDSIDRSVLLTIRLKSKKRWLHTVIRAAILLILTYVFLSMGIAFFIAALRDRDFSNYHFMVDIFTFYGTQEIAPWYLIFIILTSKSMELFFYFLIIFTLYSFRKNVTVSFIVLELSYFVYFFSSNITKYLPTGIGSLARMKEFTNEGFYYWQTMAILTGANLLLYIYLRFFGNKKIFE